MGIVKNTHLCVNIKTRTQNTIMHPGENRKGMLSMNNEDNFEFDEQLPQSCERNPIVWHGEYINVHRDKQGNYQACFRRMTIGKRFSPVRVANAISTELLTAKKVLGL